MVPEVAEGLCRIHRPDGLGRENYLAASFCYTVCTQMLSAYEQVDPLPGEISADSLDHRQRRVGVVVHRKQNLVVRVFLAAKTCEIFVGAEVHAAHGFEYANGRSVI